MSDTPIYQALLAAQKAMGPVKRDATNPHFRNKYASLESVLDTIEGPLHDNGLVMIQLIEVDPVTEKPQLVTRIIHAESGGWIDSTAPLVCKDPDNPQALGASVTYMRRYSLMALLGLTPEDDDGNAAATAPVARQENRQTARTNPPQQNNLAETEPAAEPEIVSWTVFWEQARKLGVHSQDQFKELTQHAWPTVPQHALNILKKAVRERDAALAKAQEEGPLDADGLRLRPIGRDWTK